MDFITALGFGVLGGLILNVMPCVFPVLFFKVSRVVEHADAPASAMRRDALAYLGGTWLAFAGFAALVVGLRASGQALGWGMQMQSPGFVAFLVAVLFVFGLNALGVFELRVGFHGGRSSSGPLSSLIDGLVITLVSTPCSAPFLGGAAAAALATEAAWYETLGLFWAVGFGLALPVLAIGFVPGLRRFLPRPGPWMATFKALTGFTLLGAAVWLFATLQHQADADGANGYLFFLLALGIVLWGQGHLEQLGWQGGKLRVAQVVGLAALVAVGWQTLHLAPAQRAEPTVVVATGGACSDQFGASVVDGHIRWARFNDEFKTAALACNRPIFVDFTADWCATCKVFEKTHIETDVIRTVLTRSGIVAAKADLTADEGLWNTLNALGRSGLPTYVIYHPDGQFEVLPEGPPLTLADRLNATAAKFPLN